MSLFSPPKLVKRLLANQGYEVKLHRIAKTPYTGPKIAFVHIAKCGGTSVDTALRSAIACANQHRIDRNSTIASSMATFEGHITSIEDSCRFSEHHATHLHKIFAYYLQQNWQYISGHITITEELINCFKNNYAFITILRNPVERFISNYIFNKLTNKQAIMLPNSLSTDNIINEAKEILNSKRGWQMANLPTMYLTGRYPKNQDDAKAMQFEFSSNLAQFKVVGFLDNLSKFARDCQKLTGKDIYIGQRNTTDKLNLPEQIKVKQLLKEFFSEGHTKELINTLCQYELENYQDALSLYGK